MATVDPFAIIASNAAALGTALTSAAATADESEMLQIILEAIRRWTEQSVDDAAIDAAGRMPREVVAQAAELGLFGLTIPEAYGGAGFSMSAACRVIEEVATADRSVATCIGLHCGLGLRGLIRYASEDLKRHYLPDMATGKLLGAFAATEPNAGSHIAGVSTTGTEGADGKLHVTGQKIYVTNGGLAQVFTVVAKTPGLAGARHGWSVFLFEKSDAGLVVGAEEHKLGIKASSTTTLDLDDVALDPSRIVGEPSKGLEAFHEILSWGRTMMSAGCLGTARVAYDRAVEQVMLREQFNRPIGEFGQVRQKIATMRATLYGMESVQRLVTKLQDLYDADISWVSSIAKIYNSEGAWNIVDDVLQLFGGSGFIEETGIARILRDSRITRIFEGANEVLRFNLASVALTVKDRTPWSLEALVVDALKADARRYDDASARIEASITALKKRYGFRVFDHQVLLAGLANALIARVVMLASLLRLNAELDSGVAPATGKQDLRLVTYLCHDGMRQIEAGIQQATWDEEEQLINAISSFEYDGVKS
ncbi:MAG: hypothetical protein AUK47_18950 [Deltaproteobacteria bacterium CG2_30_63_29]|nr:MAG: hypothetical protein AUK47_18950 [Deltaproteobacteria bacterium CG2_30_63_29]